MKKRKNIILDIENRFNDKDREIIEKYELEKPTNLLNLKRDELEIIKYLLIK